MTYQEILEEITENRAVKLTSRIGNIEDKISAIEWALQALAEKLRDDEFISSPAPHPSDVGQK